MTVYRCYVEKRPEFAVEAAGVARTLSSVITSGHVEAVRLFNRYDLEGIEEADYRMACTGILSEPQVDVLYHETAPDPMEDEWVFASEYLPGQFDQRADSAAQCIQLSTCRARPEVRTAKLYYIKGALTKEEKQKIRETLVNPVEAREASLEKPETIRMDYAMPDLPPLIEGFTEKTEAELEELRSSMGLAMDLADITFLQGYFRDEEHRDPTVTEVRVIDTYWSDHCRHTTFNTILNNVTIEPEYIQKTYEEYLKLRNELYGSDSEKPVSLWDIATIAAKALKKRGKLSALDESEEINACSVKIPVDVDGSEQQWLLMFKNETHNHPTEIEPFGGAATCLGGAIRDPLSGRSYVYQAMRITGAADPLTPVEKTMKGKLPQSRLTVTAANGYSSYGNQIGLATGHVHELYHSGYAAKRMEIGAVLGAAPLTNVIRRRPMPGDVVILLGGRTGRDGCGGATGSSKSHTVESLETCGAEVQKGNAPEERKLQRLFRNPEATRLIKRCNDFGAGGVSVAIGELADGLLIDLTKVPKKYEGLDGTELAISESQERMAVVTAKGDAEAFRRLADAENLESTIVAEVTEEKRLVMMLDGTTIVDIARSFLDTNGARRSADAEINQPVVKPVRTEGSLEERFEALAGDLNIASQKGLEERFDSTIGAGTVLMPYGGAYQLSPSQAMACRIPVLNGETNTCSLMGWGFDPYESEISPYQGSQDAVITSIAKVIAAGGSTEHCWLSLQEYFGRTGSDPKRWGTPMSALLGAWKAQMELEIAAIGGKDSMSGTFEQLDVPPTLVSFAVSYTTTDHVVSTEFKGADHPIILLKPDRDSFGMPDYRSVNLIFREAEQLIAKGAVLSARVLESGGIAEALFKMGLGNRIGVELEKAIDNDTLFAKCAGAFVFELRPDAELPLNAVRLGTTTDSKTIRRGLESVSLADLQKKWEAKLEPVFPYLKQPEQKPIPSFRYQAGTPLHASYTVEHPHVLIPVFPGTNCEWDTAHAYEKYGAEAEIFVIRNRTPEEIEESVDRFVTSIQRSQIIAIPGGFSGGDEPEGSGKFIVSFFRNPKIKEEVHKLLDEREGLMCGICNGFQALIKLGLVPYGHITETDEHSPTLTYNSIGRHQSMLVRTRAASVKSPWMKYMEAGEVTHVAISHGEGRFVCEQGLFDQLVKNGQIAFQYVDENGHPTSDIRYNPNNSFMAVEGITSPDGRILGKMGHSERTGNGLYRNIPDLKTQELLFKGAVEYFR
ncbi:MAG: phosphoribosylformylglycinamidine synthase [Solobacterium sp.]|nr:phosphoribosylformylglycinamidine synthase [Solobacterium sp.]